MKEKLFFAVVLMAKTITYIFVCLICVSCTTTQMVEIESKTVSLSESGSEQHFSNIFYDYHLTFLKTGDTVFRNIDKLKIWNGNYYIMDKTGKNVFLYLTDFISRQMDYDYVLDVARNENGIVVFHSNKGNLYYFRSNYDEDEAIESKYIDWMPKMLCVNNGVVYSSMSPKAFSQYKELFPDSVAEKVRAQDNDMILSFKIK